MDILVIEDDPLMGKALQRGLREAGDTCTWETDGRRGLESALEHPFDCIVLDVMLPGESGFDVLDDLRHRGLQTPVVLLTARGSVDDRVRGLNTGADDYVVKPFAFAELLARLHAVCRRSTAPRPGNVVQAGEVTLDMATRRVRRGDFEIDLTPTEFSLLEFLMRHAGQVVTRTMLCEHLWESDWQGVTNVIEVHVNRLRGKLDRGFSSSLIQTVRGRGYAFRSS